MVNRTAFTLIELIFAIVIIAITVVSLPMMNQVLTKNIENNLIQEAVFGAATVLNETATYHWDENSIDANNSTGFANVINIAANCEDTKASPRYRLRPGHILQPYHRRCIKDLTIQTSDAGTKDEIDDINDLVGISNLFIDGNTSREEGYKNLTYKVRISVNNTADFGSISSSSDIKQITADVLDPNGNTTIVSLTSYIANIGEIDYYKKRLF